MRVSTEVTGLFTDLDRKQREAFAGVVDDYRVACDLSRGPDPDRSAQWEKTAKVMENRLLNRLRQASGIFDDDMAA